MFQRCFQNRRQLGSSRAATSTRQTSRQYRRATPYVSPRPQQGKKSIEKRITIKFYLMICLFSLFCCFFFAANCPQEVTQSNFKNSKGLQLDEQQEPQLQDCSLLLLEQLGTLSPHYLFNGSSPPNFLLQHQSFFTLFFFLLLFT